MCPGSPAKPLAPRTQPTADTKPPPMPVPSVTSTTSVAPSPRRACHSASVAHVASLSTVDGTAEPLGQQLAERQARPRRPRWARPATRRPVSTRPAAPTPNVSKGAEHRSQLGEGVEQGRRAPYGVGTRSSRRTAPAPSTTTPRHFVPPMSTPALAHAQNRRRAPMRPSTSRSALSISTVTRRSCVSASWTAASTTSPT